MKLANKGIITALVILFILSAAALVYMLYNTDPQEAGLAKLISIYGLILLISFSCISLLGYIFRLLFVNINSKYLSLINSLRQGLLLGVMIVAVLVLQAQNLFNLFTALIIFLILTLIELYSLST